MADYPCPECGKPMKQLGNNPRTWFCPECNGDVGKVHEQTALGGNAWNTQPVQKHQLKRSAAKETLEDHDRKDR